MRGRAPLRAPIAAASAPASAAAIAAAMALSLSAWSGLVGPSAAAAQDAADTRVGHASDALPGLGRVAVPRSVPWLVGVSASAGYGFTEDVLADADSHHRLAARFAGAVQPAPFLAVGLQLDGRYDSHSAASGGDDGLVGDPRLILRGMHELGPVSVGAQVTTWLPGDNAPSVVFGALSLDLEALVGVHLGDLTLAANAGYRLDRSAQSIDDPDRLSPADRLALGLSESDALLLGVGLGYRAGAMEVFAEWTWDLLLGGGAPSSSAAPMRAGAGGRLWLGASDAIQLEARLEALLSARPDVGTGQPLAPVEPRFAAHVGVAFRFPSPEGSAGVVEGGASTGGGSTSPPPPTTGIVRGRVTDADGQPVAGAQVRVTRGDATLGPATTGDDGAYEVRDVPFGTAGVSVSAEGFRVAESTVEVTATGPAQAEVSVERDLPNGQIRGVIQSFSGEAVAATVRVEPLGQEVPTDAEGAFQIDVPPGEYEVVVTSAGYTEQRRPLRVEERGVTILNVDLRREGGRHRR